MNVEWINCKDQLPEEGLTVIHCHINEPESAWYGHYNEKDSNPNENLFYFDDDNFSSTYKATHWMPFPKQPIKE